MFNLRDFNYGVCGTVEKVHNVMKNDLGGRVMPCGRYYANAAWWRLNCITYNVISIMKRKALPQGWWACRRKALRYWVIGVAGRIIRTGRRIYLRFSGTASMFNLYVEARGRLVEFAQDTHEVMSSGNISEIRTLLKIGERIGLS